MKTVWVNGCFDLLHAGHVDFLQRARALGDSLVVFLNSDASIYNLKGPGRPTIREKDRTASLMALSCVNQVWVFSGSDPVASWVRNPNPSAIYVQTLRPDVLESKEVEWCMKNDVPVVLLGREHPESTTAIIERIRNAPGSVS